MICGTKFNIKKSSEWKSCYSHNRVKSWRMEEYIPLLYTVGSTRWAKWQTFLLFYLLQFLTYKDMMYLKLNLRPCVTN